MPNINKINDAWVTSGQKVADLDSKISAALLDDKFDKEAFASLKDNRDTEMARRDSLKEQLDVERKAQEIANMNPEDITPLASLDDDSAKIGDNDDPQLTLIKYAIKRYAGITTATNTLLKDTAENILAWLSNWIAKKVVVTRNQAIIGAMNNAPKKPTLATFDDIKDMENTSVDPAVKQTSIFLTNTSGFAQLAKVKDVEGRYLIQPSVTNPELYMIGGKQIVVISDRWLSNVGTKDTPAYPLYFGDLKQAITLFDRENMSLYTTDVGGGAFETDTTKIRVIDRFDVQPTDTEAFVAGSFTAIADQQAPTPAASK